MADAYPGFFGPPQGTPINNDQFAIDQELARIMTMIPVKVLKVYPGNFNPTPTTVDVQVAVDMINPQGKRTAHVTLYGVPAARHHAGGTAVLIDPVVGDVGMMQVAHRDISSLKTNNGARSGPGSARRHDLSDGVYHGGLWTQNPTNYIDLRGGNMVHSTTGNITHSAQGTITISAQGGFSMGSHTDVIIKPLDPTKKVYLGGDPANGGVFLPVMLSDGSASDNTYAHKSGPT